MPSHGLATKLPVVFQVSQNEVNKEINLDNNGNNAHVVKVLFARKFICSKQSHTANCDMG